MLKRLNSDRFTQPKEPRQKDRPPANDRKQGYKLEVEQVPVRLVLFSGESLEVELFLHHVSLRGRSRQTLAERLNESATKVLAARVGDGTDLFQLRWISYLETPGKAPEVLEYEELGACRHRVDLGLVSGETLHGELLFFLPEGFRRVSDLLNTPEQRFLLFYGDGHTRYIQRGAVVRARDADERAVDRRPGKGRS